MKAHRPVKDLQQQAALNKPVSVFSSFGQFPYLSSPHPLRRFPLAPPPPPFLPYASPRPCRSSYKSRHTASNRAHAAAETERRRA